MDFVNIDIRKMNKEDLPAVMEIEELSFVSKWKKENFLEEFNNPFSNMWVIELSNEKMNLKSIVGFVVFWITFDSATICQIAVHPEIRRRQLGKAMLDELYNDCYAKKVSTITLEVRKSNQIAINFYKSYGFEIVQTKEKYYSNGEDAYYMVLKVK